MKKWLKETGSVLVAALGVLLVLWVIGALLGVVGLGFRMVAG